MMGGQKRESVTYGKCISYKCLGVSLTYTCTIYCGLPVTTFGRYVGRALGNRIVDARGMSPRRRVRIGLVYRPPMREGSTER